MSVVTNTGVVLSLIGGTVAGTLGLLAWKQFRDSPFGQLLSIIPVVYAGFVGFHAFILITGVGHGGLGASGVSAVEAFESLAFAGLAVFTVQAIRLHAKMSRKGGRR